MSAESEKVVRPKRKAPVRRTPSIIEQRTPQPFMFGWGSHLNRHEREALKERVALIGGIALALLLAVILGWGWLQDNVLGPANRRAADSKPVAVVGKATITMGLFKRYENFQVTQLNSQAQQIQQQISALQADPKKNAAALQQLQAQSSLITQRLGSVSSGALTSLIDNQTILQRSGAVGIPATKKIRDAAMTQLMHQAGGRRHLATFIQQSGLTESEISDQVTADNLRRKLQTKLQAAVPRAQDKVRASHILLPASKKAIAEKLLKQIQGGANFAQLAKKYSTDPGSGKKGGDLGYFAHGAMVPPFDKAAFSMKVGEVRLVKSSFGWHIIKLTGRQHAKLSATEYSQAQQAAYTTWITNQQAKLHVLRLVAPDKLPAPVSTPVASLPSSGLPTSNGLPTSQNPVPAQIPAPKPVVPKTGKSSKSSKGTTAKP